VVARRAPVCIQENWLLASTHKPHDTADAFHCVQVPQYSEREILALAKSACTGAEALAEGFS